jgi:hypothetical protein
MILLLRDDNWTRFLSDRGPVPDPRAYPIPPEEVAAAIVERRFGPIFAALRGTDEAPAPKRKQR